MLPCHRAPPALMLVVQGTPGLIIWLVPTEGHHLGPVGSEMGPVGTDMGPVGSEMGPEETGEMQPSRSMLPAQCSRHDKLEQSEIAMF